LKKSLLPLFGLTLTAVLVLQMRGTLGGAEPAAASVKAPIADPGAGRGVAEGRVGTYPGAEVVVAADLPGTLVRLAVAEKQPVRKGQLLAELRADDLRAELAEAQAKVDEAAADIRFADVDTTRAERLLAEKVG